jgi:hypothetical protein
MAFTANIFNNFLGMFLPSEEEMDKTLKSFQALRVKVSIVFSPILRCLW